MMISQKQMKLRIPEALEQFQLAMPAVNAPYPEIRFASDKIMKTYLWKKLKHQRVSLMQKSSW